MSCPRKKFPSTVSDSENIRMFGYAAKCIKQHPGRIIDAFKIDPVDFKARALYLCCSGTVREDAKKNDSSKFIYPSKNIRVWQNRDLGHNRVHMQTHLAKKIPTSPGFSGILWKLPCVENDVRLGSVIDWVSGPGPGSASLGTTGPGPNITGYWAQNFALKRLEIKEI
uniref:Uncharacterized protein n=1 Tax=Romanomermis culicivorax TaxID=13658 RepID=A0A915J752_ROMCU